jgi:uncharacterized protein YkwD
MRNLKIVLLISAIAAALLVSFVPFPADASPEGATPDEREILDNTNRERAINHLAPLKWDAALTSAARAHSGRMARERNISHEFPGEPALSERVIQSGARYSALAENVGEGPSLLEIHIGWMHSPGHRANILNSNLDSIGIGVAERNGQFFVTQDFSRSLQSLSFEEQERRFGELLQAEGLKLDPDPAAARKACEAGHADTTKTRSLYEFHYTTSDLSSLPKMLEDTIREGRYHIASVGACSGGEQTRSGMYRLSVLLF